MDRVTHFDMMNTNTTPSMDSSRSLNPRPLTPSSRVTPPWSNYQEHTLRQDPRVPFGGTIRLVFGEFRDFVMSCKGNISISGMYLPTKTPLPRGSIFEFELMVGEDMTLVRGVGQVVRSQPAAGPDASHPGMAIRFTSLDAAGRELIFRTVDRHIQSGGRPFDLDGPEWRGSQEEPGFWSARSDRGSEAGSSNVWDRLSTTVKKLLAS